MIYTVTLNPAIDKTIVVEGFTIDTMNRIKEVINDPGGKGINVSKMVKNLGGESQIIAITGGQAGEKLGTMIDALMIDKHLIYCQDETRTNTKVVDPINNTFTDLNEPGPNVSETVVEEIVSYLNQNLKKGDVLVLSGSVPKGVDQKIYRRLSQVGNNHNAFVLLDAEGQLLIEGIESQPYLIKPNALELASYFGKSIETKEALVEHSLKLLEKGIKVIVLTLGSEGCLLITASGIRQFKALKVEVQSTVGAGDSMLGAIAYELDCVNKVPSELSLNFLETFVARGVAASAATISEPGTTMGSLKNIETLLTKVVSETYKVRL